ncbi:MAG: DUF1512 family protein [Candidatus Bathyarchaeia archaeon]
MASLSLESILNVIYLGSFVVFFVYGQRIQKSIILLNVREAADAAHNRVRRIIQTETAPGDTVIVARIGNTIGID